MSAPVIKPAPYTHLRSGRTYWRIADGARLEHGGLEGSEHTIYVCESTRRVWVRPTAEFDARFEPLSGWVETTTATDGGAVAALESSPDHDWCSNGLLHSWTPLPNDGSFSAVVICSVCSQMRDLDPHKWRDDD